MAIINGTISHDVTDGFLEADIIEALGGDDTVRGFEDNDGISGNDGNDFLNGNMGDDTVDGGEGNDIVRGGKNNDVVIGGAGDDTLFGDLGGDTLIGGEGADVFYLRRNSLGTDVMLDFTPGVDRFEFVDELKSSDILTNQGTGANAGDTIITDQITGQVMAIVQGVSNSAIASSGFGIQPTPTTENAGASTTTPSAQVTEQTNQLSSTEKAVVAEINRARTNPAAYADWLENMKQYFDGNELKIPGRPSFTTTTGAAGFDEAIQYMKSVSPAPPVTISNGLYLAARDHAQDLATNGGNIPHVGTDGSTVSDRMSRYGSFSTSYYNGENIASASSSFNWPELFIMLMIVDDWEPTRGHRLNTMKPVFQEVGVACAPNTSGVTNCVMDFAAGYTDSPNLPPLAGIEDLSNDTLTGNINSNVFALQPGGKNQVITDFEDGIDFLGLANGVAFEQLAITPGDGATLINLNGQTLASLTGVEASNISQEDFILI